MLPGTYVNLCVLSGDVLVTMFFCRGVVAAMVSWWVCMELGRGNSRRAASICCREAAPSELVHHGEDGSRTVAAVAGEGEHWFWPGVRCFRSAPRPSRDTVDVNDVELGLREFKCVCRFVPRAHSEVIYRRSVDAQNT